MKTFACCLFFLGLGTSLFADDMSRSWKVVYAGPPRTGPKTVGSKLLDLKVAHGDVSGTVKLGDHLTFTATGHLSSTTGIPTCQLDVTVRGNQMFVKLTTVKNGGGPLPLGATYEYKGARRN